MKKKYFKKNKFTTGYTLVETMIAIAIFLIVVVIGAGSLANVHLLNKKSQNTRSILDSLSYVIEDMSRNIRTGYDYRCIKQQDIPLVFPLITTPQSCENGYGITFKSSLGDQWIYVVAGDEKLYRSANGFNDSVQMTPDEVHIKNVGSNFLVLGAEPYSSSDPNSDRQQPFVVIRIVGTITSGGVDIPFSLQTAVSQRKTDI